MAATLGHVHLRVGDLDRSVDFYADVLGIEERERYRNYAFLSGDDRHHELALQAVGEGTPGPTDGVGLYHTAWAVDTDAALRATVERLRDRGVAVTPVDHGISHAVYFDDPDGNGVEVYRDTREERDREAWRGMAESFDPTG